MNRRPIKEESIVKIGGTIVAKYHAHADEVELILIVRSHGMYFAVVTRGRQAHRALPKPPGTPVRITGAIYDYMIPDGCGFRITYVVYCQRMVFGDTLQQPSPGPLEGFDAQLPRHQIFEKCDSLNR